MADEKHASQEMRITPQTLNRYIQHGRLDVHIGDGDVYVNADQLREIWRGKRMLDENPQTRRKAS